MTFESVAEQHEAKRLLAAVLADGPAHAYLLHGPPGVGKRATALAFAAELLAWLEEVEYGEFALPRPDLVVLLDAPVALARQLVARKAARNYTTLEADIHEADTEHSRATRDLYLELAARNNWRVVSTEGDDGEPREVGEVGDEIWRSVEPLLA